MIFLILLLLIQVSAQGEIILQPPKLYASDGYDICEIDYTGVATGSGAPLVYLWVTKDLASTNWILFDSNSVVRTAGAFYEFFDGGIDNTGYSSYHTNIDDTTAYYFGLNDLFFQDITNVGRAGDYWGTDSSFNPVLIHGGSGYTNVSRQYLAFFRVSQGLSISSGPPPPLLTSSQLTGSMLSYFYDPLNQGAFNYGIYTGASMTGSLWLFTFIRLLIHGPRSEL